MAEVHRGPPCPAPPSAVRWRPGRPGRRVGGGGWGCWCGTRQCCLLSGWREGGDPTASPDPSGGQAGAGGGRKGRRPPWATPVAASPSHFRRWWWGCWSVSRGAPRQSRRRGSGGSSPLAVSLLTSKCLPVARWVRLGGSGSGTGVQGSYRSIVLVLTFPAGAPESPVRHECARGPWSFTSQRALSGPRARPGPGRGAGPQ